MAIGEKVRGPKMNGINTLRPIITETSFNTRVFFIICFYTYEIISSFYGLYDTGDLSSFETYSYIFLTLHSVFWIAYAEFLPSPLAMDM